MVKNPPYNAEDMGLIPGQGTNIPHAMGQLSPHATITEPTHHNYRAHASWSLHATTREEKTHRPQLERSPSTATKIPRAITKT